jgi:tRNA U34 5-methylaminomethyl-2-thiouridine-forming methyltransferase MnmC
LASGKTQITLVGNRYYTLEEILSQLFLSFAAPYHTLQRAEGKLTGVEFEWIKNSSDDLTILELGNSTAVPVIWVPKVFDGDRREQLTIGVRELYGVSYSENNRAINNYSFDLIILDEEGPSMAKDSLGSDLVSLNADHTKVTLTFDEAIFANTNGEALKKEQFEIYFAAYASNDSNETVEITKVEHTAGSNIVILYLSLSGNYTGDTLLIKTVQNDAFDVAGNSSTPSTQLVLP